METMQVIVEHLPHAAFLALIVSAFFVIVCDLMEDHRPR